MEKIDVHGVLLTDFVHDHLGYRSFRLSCRFAAAKSKFLEIAVIGFAFFENVFTA
jgi:hypothetical protein